MYMEVLSVSKIWDQIGSRLRMREREVVDTGGRVEIRDTVYYYTVYDHRARIQEETIKQSQVDLRA